MYRHKHLLVHFFAIVAGFFSATVAASPIIYYSDLDSAPKNAYITLWGNDFGEQEGSIRIADQQIGSQSIVSWTNKRIEFQLPVDSGQNLTVVTFDGEPSNVLSFSTRTEGRLFFVSSNDGDDSNDGSYQNPWLTLSPVLSRTNPGDIVYLRDGVYDELGDSLWRSNLRIQGQFSGEPGLPKALVAFPGEVPVIGGLGGAAASRAVYLTGGVTDWTISKLRLRASAIGIGVMGGDSARIRVVGNVMSDIPSPYGTIISEACTDCKILGNHVSNSGIPGNKLSHLIYYDGFGSASNVEIAWNLLHDEKGGRCIQVYGHVDSDSLSGLSIHDNTAFNCPYDGILVGSSDAAKKDWIADAEIYNNVVYNCGDAGIRIDSPGVRARVLHNTLDNNEYSLRLQQGEFVEIKNNIFSLPLSSSASQILFDSISRSAVDMSHNGYYGGSGTDSTDQHPVVGDPLFSNPTVGDYSLSPESPFVRAGTRIAPPMNQFFLTPQDSTPDLGALTSIEAFLNIIRPLAPTLE